MKKQKKNQLGCNDGDQSANMTVEETVSSSGYSLSTAGSSSESGGGDSAQEVRFAMNAIEYHEVESNENFSSKERARYWWSDREKDRMIAKHERLVAKYEKQKMKKPGSSSSSTKSTTSLA